ncbi:glutathione S-transferase family protein [Dokdonella soli]|uniref:Glutathione S-transferase family protein n=1 Tax=Dokdonella soli TaxID=529810 RepID=A0ABN1IYR5_9GAMM
MNARPMLVIGNKNYSSWPLRPWLLLRQHGIAFDEMRLPMDTPAFASDILHWSPSGRVSALRHGDLTIWDSLAICEYVNETFLDGAGWPVAAPARATARSVSAEMHSGFQALREALPMNCRKRASGFVVNADARRDIGRIVALWRDCRARFGAQDPFLFGAFSIADAMYAPVALRFQTYGVVLDADARAYVDALLALPALMEWLRDAAAETETLPHTDRVA